MRPLVVPSSTPGYRQLVVLAFAFTVALGSTAGLAQEPKPPVKGASVAHTSPSGIEEACVVIDHIPGAEYSGGDKEKEKEYCAIDFAEVALCPKLWSTSPGTVLYSLPAPADAAAISAFESSQCARGKRARQNAEEKLATFKVSINGQKTSGTYAPSSWVYYHLSRFLDVGIYVPVAVYRDIDLQHHKQRVTIQAQKILASRSGANMLKEGWKELARIEAAANERETTLSGGTRIFGTLIDGRGDRYGAEINGTRKSGWGDGQNRDFQQTAPYLALRNPKPIPEAIVEGIAQARKDPAMAKALPADIADAQVAFWMRDILEITLLDYLLTQQDRIGNIDADWRWYWVKEGKVHSDRAKTAEPPKKAEGHGPVRLRQSVISDNDAGVRRTYANYAKRTDMLANLRHYDPALYARLRLLHEDVSNKGEIYQWMTGSAGLSTREADSIAARVVEAWSLLSADCKAGTLKLDLVPGRFLNQGDSVQPAAQNCG